MKYELPLSFSTRKALNVHLGEEAGEEISKLINRLLSQLDELKQTKVNVTSIVPRSPSGFSVFDESVIEGGNPEFPRMDLR